MKALPQAICWYEGMQLLPQHFQLQALRGEAVAAALAAAAQPYYWGVLGLEVDEAALAGGVARVFALQAILPDGLPLLFDGGDGIELSCDIAAEATSAPQRMATVYLALPPLWRAGRLDPQSGRYRSVNGEAVPDLSSGDNPASLAWWLPDIRLVTDSGRADMVCLPLLRVAQQGGGFARLPYAPPCPRVEPDDALGRGVAELCAQVREKCVFLSGRLRQARETGNEDDMEEISRLLAALWQRLPEVEAALGSRVCHPSALFSLLAGMAGSMSVLHPGAGVPVFPSFDYLDLLACYQPVLAWLSGTLARVRAGYRSLAFNRDDAGFWLALPEAARGAERLVIGLRMPSGAPESAARQWLEQAIIASAPHLETLSRQRMRGLAVRALERSEQVAYSVGDDTRLFVLLASGEWFLPEEPLWLAYAAGATAIAPWEALLFVPEPQEPGHD
ncbi:type VI secretion system baseplate subunit TssK [Chromobacterium paludis]|uniref:Type VI secretion system baseplate subunit TssK n=1 Tax=Chromobacterium paludis TaxID=2605945 RepID=A0A5C1DGR7_9NEIS|nr:type VI secretion system baseplate subunit TssK [Chromobacterium paludis]QEL55950.1 type VI secretion system baseplate subunit TssK [Chromobacterium paludis]